MFTKINTLVPFLEEPSRKFHLRELSKILKMSPAGTRKVASIMLKFGLISETRERNLRLFQASSDNRMFKEYKKFYTVFKIYDSGLIDFLNSAFLYPVIVLFGSASRGEDFKNSDLDFFILSNQKKEQNLDVFEKKLSRKIQLFVMNQKSLVDLKRKSPELFNNILNGIKLEGFLKVV